MESLVIETPRRVLFIRLFNDAVADCVQDLDGAGDDLINLVLEEQLLATGIHWGDRLSGILNHE